ncbi:MAG: molybdenum ABC transporter ATP-binding protein [Pseudomonadota bacterium]
MARTTDGAAGGCLMLEVDIRAQLGALHLNVRFQVPSGVTVLFGASGAGKTSVVNAIAGLLRPDAGRIALGGRVLFDGATQVLPHRRKVGYVFQDARLFPHMTVEQNLAYGGRHRFDDLVELLGLRGLLARRPAGLSGGEKQRVALARALMSAPDVLLLDEPLAALDGPRKAEVLPYLQALARSAGVPVVYVTHAMAEVIQLADRIVIMDAGSVAMQGLLEAVLADPASARFFAKRDGGAILPCTVARHDAGVTVLASAAGEVLLPGTLGTIGGPMRLSVPAQDVILSKVPLEGQSALNMLEAKITEIGPLPNGNLAVSLMAGAAPLWAEVTPMSVAKLGLAPGQVVHAVFKATAVGPV